MASLTPPISRPVVLDAVQTLDVVLAELTATSGTADSHDDAVERVAGVRRKLAGELWGYTELDAQNDASRPEPGPMEAPDLVREPF